jgi:hypothetical protein
MNPNFRRAGIRQMTTRPNKDADQARTKTHDVSGHRPFNVDRVQDMNRSIPTLTEGRVWSHGADDIHAASTLDGRPYVCVFGRDSGKGRYDFRTAHPLDGAAHWNRRRAELKMRPTKPQQEKTPMTEAMGAATMLQVFSITPGASQLPPERTGSPVMAVASFELDHWAVFCKALPAGARWITVRPNGPGTEGHAVMIQPSGDGAYRVVGGAGGKLNYLNLTGVGSGAEYASRARDKAKEEREANTPGGVV